MLWWRRNILSENLGLVLSVGNCVLDKRFEQIAGFSAFFRYFNFRETGLARFPNWQHFHIKSFYNLQHSKPATFNDTTLVASSVRILTVVATVGEGSVKILNLFAPWAKVASKF